MFWIWARFASCATDLGWNATTKPYAATQDLSESDDDIPINKKITKPRSSIKKATKAMKPPTKRPAAEPPTKRPEPPTKRPAAEPPTKRPEPPTKRYAAEPLGKISDNVGGRPKCKTKRPKKSLP